MNWRLRQAIALAAVNVWVVWMIFHLGPPYRELPWFWLSLIWGGTVALVILQIRARWR